MFWRQAEELATDFLGHEHTAQAVVAGCNLPNGGQGLLRIRTVQTGMPGWEKGHGTWADGVCEACCVRYRE